MSSVVNGEGTGQGKEGGSNARYQLSEGRPDALAGPLRARALLTTSPRGSKGLVIAAAWNLRSSLAPITLMRGLQLMRGTHARPGTRTCLLSIAVRRHRYWPQSPACKTAIVCIGVALGGCRVGPESQTLRQRKVAGNGEALEALDSSDDLREGAGRPVQYLSVGGLQCSCATSRLVWGQPRG